MLLCPRNVFTKDLIYESVALVSYVMRKVELFSQIRILSAEVVVPRFCKRYEEAMSYINLTLFVKAFDASILDLSWNYGTQDCYAHDALS